MPIGNTTYQARASISYALININQKPKKKSFLLHPAYFSLLFLFDGATFELNNVEYVFSGILCKTLYLRLITKRLEIPQVTILLFLCSPNLFINCGK